LPLHAYGEQGRVDGVGQLPRPSHVAALVCVEPLHDCALHTLPVGYVHAIAEPLHVPPQVEPPPLHAVREPCGVPLTNVQLPTEPPTSHAWHWPVHALLQQ
jgi:hypothetical protein